MIRHIVAIDNKRGIAKEGVQPWKLQIDEQYFSEQTKKYGGVLLMGRKTFEVIGRPLPERENYVLTHDETFEAEGVKVVNDLELFLQQQQDIWIIGGSEVYAQTLSVADELYVTEIEREYGCDVFYTEYAKGFDLLSNSGQMTDNDTSFSFKVYTPRTT